MSNPFVGEIRMFGGNFAPAGWAFCDGSLQSIAENNTLFALLGTTYGGDGQNTFALPDLRGRVPVHVGSSHILGQVSGTESVSLTAGQLPAHTHALGSTGAASVLSPAVNAPALAAQRVYGASTGTPMAAGIVAAAGSGGAHENRQPYLAVSFIISLFGIFPPSN